LFFFNTINSVPFDQEVNYNNWEATAGPQS
jgi:hypothetical protein